MRFLNLNSFLQALGESAMERLKQEILWQELVFRHQVRELHRLYWTQKNLMNELRLRGINALTSKGGNALDRNGGALLNNHQRVFNLQLGDDDFMVCVEHDKENNHDSETELSKPNEISSSSLTKDNICCLPSMLQLGEVQHIRLQKQKLNISSIDVGDSAVATVNNLSSKKHGSRKELIDLNIPHEAECFHDQNHHFVKIASLSMNSSIDHHEILEVQPTKSFSDEISIASKPDSANPSSKTCEKRTEWLFHLNQHSHPHGLQDSMLTGDNATDNINNASEVVITGLASAYEVPTVCSENPQEAFTGSDCGACVCINGSSILSMDQCKPGKENSDSQPGKLQCEELSDNKRQDSNITSINSINQSQIESRDLSDKPCNHEESEEDTLSIHSKAQDDAQPDELNRKFSAEYSSNDLCSNSDCSSYEKSAEEPASLSIADDSMITQSYSQKHEISYIGKSKLEGRDVAIAAAAEALMTISSGRSAVAAEQLDKMEAVKEKHFDDRSDEPQDSSDSFEFMTMRLSEIQNDEHIVMPEMLSLNETRKDESGIRLRRGRRLRDFRKEILPGLVSLSRHEICEDLYSIGYKLRKNAPKSARGSWFVPTRNRRPRLCLGRRRL